MKSLMIAAASAAAAVALASPALAEDSPLEPVRPYGTIGYAAARWEGLDFGVIQGRLGLKLGKYVAVEGEMAGGVKGDSGAKVRHQEAIYGVVNVPVAEHIEILGRIGYSHTNVGVELAGIKTNEGFNSFNYGVGAQYFFTAKDGVRADYTGHHFNNDGGTAHVWSIAYVRKFP